MSAYNDAQRNNEILLSDSDDEKNDENVLNTVDNHNATIQDTDYNNIPSFLKRNRD